jgi:nitrite reductase (NADH) small subunit
VATDNRCPHKGGPLADGIVSGDSVVCPLHAWRINLIGGAVDRPAGLTECVETYPTFVDNGIIVVGLPAAQVSKEAGAAA